MGASCLVYRNALLRAHAAMGGCPSAGPRRDRGCTASTDSSCVNEPACPPLCRDILAIPETRADWWQLYVRHLKPRVDAGSARLVLVNSDRMRGTGS